ncbi:MAG: hypothetical protein ACKVP0_09975 [Pirellulaceae bacterium]
MLSVLLVLGSVATTAGDDFDREPISYSTRQPDNRVSKLIAELQSGKKSLKREPHFGYLRSLLTELQVPQSSQMLVFSKTSLQRHRIAPSTPRALYFSDDTYIGFCQDGEVLEITAADKDLGAVFYVLEQEADSKPHIKRQTENCLICHGSSSTKGVPGHLVRSVYSDASGLPILAAGTYRTNHSSPFRERWGSWYVSGTHGDQLHLGNLIVRGRQRPEDSDNAAGQNVTDLSSFFDTEKYLSPHSDVVALMVLEHQAEAQNYITQANFGTRQALHYEQSLNRELGKPADEHWDSTKSRIKSVCEPLLEYLLFSEETTLTHKVQGTSKFAEEFSQLGPRDKQGRSLRELDLNRRMFKYPCSYLIYSEAFAALPREAKDYVLRRLQDVLSGKDTSKRFSHLSASDRQNIREILLETLPGLSDNWR